MMDEIDQKIVALLSANSRMSATEIGKKVHRSRVAVVKRIDALVNSGEITSFGVRLKRKAWSVLFEIAFEPGGQCDALVPRFRSQYPVNNAWSVTGKSDLFIWAEAETSEAIHAMRNYLLEQPDVANVTTHSVIKSYG